MVFSATSFELKIMCFFVNYRTIMAITYVIWLNILIIENNVDNNFPIMLRKEILLTCINTFTLNLPLTVKTL